MFKALVADPPWQYQCWSEKGNGRSADQHYQCMTKEDIYNLDVASICDKDCVLFLWVTPPTLEQGLETMRRWGFTYKTKGFNWVKRNQKALSYDQIIEELSSEDFNKEKLLKKLTDRRQWFMANGYYSRSNSEDCLIGVRGKPPKILDRGVLQIVDSPVTKHSQKPEEIQNRIERLVGKDLPKCELFARRKREGWTCLGNEIDGLDIREALKLTAIGLRTKLVAQSGFTLEETSKGLELLSGKG